MTMVGLVSIVVFGLVLLCCIAILWTRDLHIHLTGDAACKKSHNLHRGVVPRVGGIALYLAGLVGLALLSSTLSDHSARVLWSMWAAMSVVFGVGLVEDLTRAVSPRFRLGTTFFGALLFSMANGGFGLTAIGVAGMDWLLQFQLPQILFFAFTVAGGAHAFNLVDGQHGQCSGVAASCYAGLALTAHLEGQGHIAQFAGLMAAANLAFLIVNYPLGRIFLGDSGAYLNGGVLGVMTALLVEHSPNVSPWFAIVLVAYPIWETVFSMIRRRRSGQPYCEADTFHLHHLLFLSDGQRKDFLRYSSAPRLWLINLVPVTVAIIYHQNQSILMISAACFVCSYQLIYQRALARHQIRQPGRQDPTANPAPQVGH